MFASNRIVSPSLAMQLVASKTEMQFLHLDMAVAYLGTVGHVTIQSEFLGTLLLYQNRKVTFTAHFLCNFIYYYQ